MKNKKKIIIISSIIAIIIGLCVWDIADPPVWWRFERQKDKRAILEYVKDTYPKSVKRAGGDEFPIQFMGPYFHSVMYFELDGLRFAVGAKHGEISFDNYSGMRVYTQIDKIVQDGFMKPNGIIAKTTYTFVDSYDMYPYTGDLGVRVTIIDQGSTPEEIGCLYDFYNYWQSEADYLRDYLVHIDIIDNQKITYSFGFAKESNYTSEAEFYAAFEPGP